MNRKSLRRVTLPLIAVCLVLADCSGTTNSSTGPTTAFAVMRFTSAGALDTNFAGGRGIAITDIDPGLFDFALAAAVQPADDKILAGGSSGLAGQGVVALVRYDKFGVLDPSFGSGGIVRTTLAGVAATASAIAVQPDGNILVAALTFTASSNATGIALLRYTATGLLDPTFGNAGIVPTAAIGPGLAGDTCALALQVDGKIVVAGASTNGNIVLYRYNTDGTLDTTGFGTSGTGGTTVTTLPTAAMSPAIALQSTGRIVLVSGTNVDQVALRYNTNGTPDTAFGPSGANGVVVTDAGGTDFANAVAVQADDGIVVVGHANVDFNADASDISLVRYISDGTLDTTFGNGGIVTTDLNGKFDNAFSVALLPTSILVSGNTGAAGISQAVVLRYTSTGALDPAFGPGGLGYTIAPLIGPSNIASGNAVVLQSAPGIIVAGYD